MYPYNTFPNSTTASQLMATDGNNLVTSVPNILGEVAVTDDNSTNATMYPLWVVANSGDQATYVSSDNFQWNPSNGQLYLNGSLGSPATEAALSFGTGYSTGNFIKFDTGGGGRNIGIELGGGLFMSCNLDFLSGSGFQYNSGSSAGAVAVIVDFSGGSLSYAVPGTGAATINPALTWDFTGNVNVANLTPGMLVGTDPITNDLISVASPVGSPSYAV